MSLKRGIFYTFLTQAPTLLLYFVASTLMTRILGDQGRGAYALLQNQVALLAMLLGFNTGFGITYFTSKAGADPSKVVGIAASMLIVNIIGAPLLLALIFWNNDLRGIFMPEEAFHWGYVTYVGVSVLLSQLITAIGAIMLGMKKFRILNRMTILSALLSAVGFGLLYLFRERMQEVHVLPAVIGITFTCALALTVSWCYIYVREVGILPSPTWSWSVLKPFMALALIGYGSNLINMINYRFDIWVVGNFAGTAQLGLYAVAVGMGQLFFYIPEPFSRVVQPFLYDNMEPEMLAKFKFIVRINFTSVMLLSLGLGISAPWIVPLLFGQTFHGSVIALQWLLPGILFVSGSKLIGLLVIEGGYFRYSLYSTIIAAAFTIVLDLVLIPRLGIVGASIASSVSYLPLLAVPCLVIRYKMGIPVWDMFLLRSSDLARIRALVSARLLSFMSK